MRISVVIPAFNEAATIEKCLARVHETPFDKEIIVVDDGSSDGTRDIVRHLCTEGGMGIKAVFHERNMGKGAALQTGFKAVSGDVVIIQDADLEQDPGDYQKLVSPIMQGEADVVYGSRYLGQVKAYSTFRQYLGNQLLTFLSNRLFQINLSDMETGYKVFTREVLEQIEFRSRRFGFEPEFTAKVAKKGFRIAEVPVHYSPRSHAQGKKIKWKDGLTAILALLFFRFFD